MYNKHLLLLKPYLSRRQTTQQIKAERVFKVACVHGRSVKKHPVSLTISSVEATLLTYKTHLERRDRYLVGTPKVNAFDRRSA